MPDDVLTFLLSGYILTASDSQNRGIASNRCIHIARSCQRIGNIRLTILWCIQQRRCLNRGNCGIFQIVGCPFHNGQHIRFRNGGFFRLFLADTSLRLSRLIAGSRFLWSSISGLFHGNCFISYNAVFCLRIGLTLGIAIGQIHSAQQFVQIDFAFIVITSCRKARVGRREFYSKVCACGCPQGLVFLFQQVIVFHCHKYCPPLYNGN